jgi:hypothetical protein
LAREVVFGVVRTPRERVVGSSLADLLEDLSRAQVSNFVVVALPLS